MKKLFRILVYSLFLVAWVSSYSYSTDHVSPDNTPIEDFALLDQNGKFHQLYYYADMKAIVLISHQNGCPIIERSIPYLNELSEKYKKSGVLFFMIDPNPEDTRDSLVKEAKDYAIHFPVLEDNSQVISESLDLHRTAEAILIDPHSWTIVYRGPIYDEFGYETQKAGRTNNYLENAITSFLSNRPVPKPATMVKGCLFDLNSPPKPVTFVADAAPILINRCIICHSPGQIAPWSMDSYGKVKSWGPMIREDIRTKRMPPWGADPYYGDLKYVPSLTGQEEKTLVDWVEQGMLRGQGLDPLINAPRPSSDGWPLGKPDLIISFTKTQSIPATGVLNYRTVDSGQTMGQDRWVKAIYWKPGNRRVVHHAHLQVRMTMPNAHEDWFLNSGTNLNLNKLFESREPPLIDNYSPGTVPLLLPNDTGMFLPKGTHFSFLIHYTTTGKPESDFTQVGLYFQKNTPSHILSIYYYANTKFKIPPFVKDEKVIGFIPIKYPLKIYAIKPHMHLRGRSMEFTVHFPNGTSQVILSVPHYRFYWQLRYYFKRPIVLPSGSIIEVESHFDNSPQNLDNPNPEKTVRWGDNTWDEMLVAVLYYVRLKKD